MSNIKDIIKVMAYFKVFGLDIYGQKFHGYDAGKDNLVSYFRVKKGWARKRLDDTIRCMIRNGIITRKRADVGSRVYSYSGYGFDRIHLKLVDL